MLQRKKARQAGIKPGDALLKPQFSLRSKKSSKTPILQKLQGECTDARCCVCPPREDFRRFCDRRYVLQAMEQQCV